MPFDVVFVCANDQQRVLLEQLRLRGGTGHADLFCDWILARASRAMEQISSWLYSLSEVFTLFGR